MTTSATTSNGEGAAPSASPGSSAAVATATTAKETAQRPTSRTTASAITIDRRYTSILNRLGKRETLLEVSTRRRFLAPYEMRQAISPQTTARMAELWYTRFVPAIDGLRNVLVIAPLTITWLSLAVAALAYSQALPKLPNTATTPGFFQLWQEGFPQLTAVHLGNWTIQLVWRNTHYHYWTFTDMALLDVALLATMLLLTAISQFTLASAAWRARALEMWLETKLDEMSRDSAVWSLNLSDDQPRWAAEVQVAIEALNSALTNITTAMTTFGGQMAEQGKIVKEAVTQTGAVPVAVNDLLKIYEQAIEAQKLLQSAMPSIETSLSTVSQNQMQTAADWTRMTQDLGTAIEAIARVMDRMGGSEDLQAAILGAREQWANSAPLPTRRPWWKRIRSPFSAY